jgi:hypothetical protein
MVTKPRTWRVPNNVLEIHKNIWIQLSPICCEIIETYKNKLVWITTEDSSITLKNIQENMWESKKDFEVFSGKIFLSYWNKDKSYNINVQDDIKFLGNNKYYIKISWEKYWLRGVLNNPDINILLEYNTEDSSINYTVPSKNRWKIIINEENIINRATILREKTAKTKVVFRADGKNMEFVLSFPFWEQKQVNNTNYQKLNAA